MADQSWKRQLGRTIKKARLEKGLTQEEATERDGWNAQVVASARKRKKRLG